MFKRLLSFVIAMSLFAAAVNQIPFAVRAESLQDETLLPPVYVMDFSPENGVFYDSPAGAEGRMEVARQENPDGIVFLPGSESNADNQIIKTVADGNTSRIYAKQAAKDLYVAFSKGETAGDMNCGASGAAEDYCLKSVDTSNTNSYTAVTGINFPETYGGEEDSRSKKYRFEMDWKWQAYSNLTTQTPSGSPTGATIIAFIIGGKPVYLNCAVSNDADVRGGGAFRFYESDTSSKTAFGFTGSSQRTTDESLLNSVTKTAAALPSTESGQWQHITIDFDFSAGTIDAVIQGAAEKREISTKISKGADIFAQGISGIEVRGSTKTERRINYADNIKLSPIVLPSDDDKLEAANNPPYTFDDIKGNNIDSENVTENLILPSRKEGVNVTWSVTPESASQYINLVSGQLTRPNFAQGDQTITLTPEYELGGLTLTGDPISGIVLKAEEAADFPLEPVYFMDFSPDTDGEFYDFPKGVLGRTQVTRMELSGDAVTFPGHTAVDNKSIALDSENNVSKMMPNTRTLNEYVVFSKGSAADDVNTGAGGAVDDYCLKMIDTGTVNAAPNVKITFPEAYGKPDNDNDYVKYRFEIDYKWQHFSSLTKTSSNPPTGTSWLRFHFGDSTMNLYSKSAAESTGEANGNSALCFTSTAFGMGATTNQMIPTGETGTVTAPMLSGSASGKWVHITVDFDFEDGTVDAAIEGNGNTTRTIHTVIPEGTGTGGAAYRSLFMEGLTGVTILGSTGGNLRAIWADNIKISPMQTVKKTPSEKLYDANNPPTVFDDIKGGNTDENQVTENLNLISEKCGVNVTWSISPSSASRFVNVRSGLITQPTCSEGNQSVSLTPTYTVAGRTLVGDPIAIVIAAMPESAQEKIERIITNSPFVFNDIKGANTSSTEVFTDLKLPELAEHDVAVSWSILPAEMAEFVDIATGKVTRPKYTDGDKTVNLIPTYKLDEIEQEGQAIEITVLKNTLDASGADIQDAYAITAADLVRAGQSPKNVTGNLILPKTGKLHGSSISWSATPLIVDTNSGAVKRPFGASEMDVVLTAAVTNGDDTTVRQFTVTVVDSNYGSGSSSSGGSRGGGGGGVAYTGNAVVAADIDSKLPTDDGNTPPSSTVFHDIEHVEWAKDYIIALHDLGVINGDGDGTFSPDRNVTREEFVKMLLLTFHVETDEEPQDAFDDVGAGSWFEPYVATAYRLKLVNGISGTKFGTGHSITRQDMASMIMRCLEYKGIVLESSEDDARFEDETEISGYAREAVENLRKAGILHGDADHNFKPGLFAKRAEVAKVLGMLIKVGEENLEQKEE